MAPSVRRLALWARLQQCTSNRMPSYGTKLTLAGNATSEDAEQQQQEFRAAFDHAMAGLAAEF
jgi:hypothetical protein